MTLQNSAGKTGFSHMKELEHTMKDSNAHKPSIIGYRTCGTSNFITLPVYIIVTCATVILFSVLVSLTLHKYSWPKLNIEILNEKRSTNTKYC